MTPPPLPPQSPSYQLNLDHTHSNNPANCSKQLSKLKRFLTTLQQFASDISPEIGDHVRNLVLNLVVCFFFQYNMKFSYYKIQTLYNRTLQYLLKIFTLSYKKQQIFL